MRFTLSLLMCVVTLCGRPTRGADVGHDSTDAALNEPALLKAAIEAEAAGDLTQRNELIASSGSDLAKSISGKIRQADGKWIEIDGTVWIHNRNDERYFFERSSTTDSIRGHLGLAWFSHRVEMPDRAQAHYEQVLNFSPDHPVARAALGHVRVNREWLTVAEQREIFQRVQDTQKSIADYGKALLKISASLNSNNPGRRNTAFQKLCEIDKIDALPAIENLLVSGPSTAEAGVTWIVQRKELASTQSLANIAVRHTDPLIRSLAIKELKSRPLADFAPQLLTILSSEILAQYTPIFDAAGRLSGFRKSYSEERFDANVVSVVEETRQVVAVARTRTEGDMDRRTFFVNEFNAFVERQAVLAMAEAETRTRYANEVIASEQERMRRNRLIEEKNSRVLEVLSQTANVPLVNQEAAWKWWDDYNYSGYEFDKPTYAEFNSVIEPTYVLASTITPTPTLASECFAAGTLVLTQRGEQPIESLITGDRVLTSNLASGALDWKTVVRPTERPATETVTIKVTDEVFRCTKGHLFWVTGKGWTRAIDLSEGDALFGASSPQIILAVEEAKPIPTFNLQVIDNHNYFVGKSRLLTHDVTRSQSSNQPIPGYRQTLANFGTGKK